MGWISHVSMVGICYNSGISVAILVLLQWSPFSISNKQYTTQSVAAKVVQQYYVMFMILRWVGIHNTQQHIICGDLVVVLPDDSACERGGRRIIHNTHQHTTYTTTISYLILIPLFEGLGTRTIGNSTI